MKLSKKVRRFVRQWVQTGTKISRAGMPNGFLFRNLIWYGDAASKEVAVSRGLTVEPGEMDTLEESSLLDLTDRLRVLQATLGEGYTLQVRHAVGSDFTDVLEPYQKDTEAIPDKWRHRWQVYNRTERYERYRLAMQERKLRRESLVVFITRVIDAAPEFSLSESSMAKHFEALARREALAFEQVTAAAVQTLFPDCRVRLMNDREHFVHYYRFLNPSVGASVPEGVFEAYDETLSIQENCLFGDLVKPPVPGISFQLDALNHAMLVMRELPKRSAAGIITRLTSLGFADYEITLNLYPQNSSKVIKQVESTANQLAGEIQTRPKRAFSLGSQLQMAKDRIEALERGDVYPSNLFFAVRLWHRDADTVISQAAIVKNALLNMGGATCHHATNAETARQLFYQTWPGWTCGTYRGFDLATDDQTAAELTPWSSSFMGRFDGTVALYDSARGGLVGVSFFVGGVPQHFLVFGATRAGKSLLGTDLWAQVAHQFGFIVVVEEGLSHGTTAQTAGAQPIVITANGDVVINYLDTGGLPLSNDHLGTAVSLCLLMLRQVGPNVDPSRVSVLQGLLTKHLNAVYDGVWADWTRLHPEEANAIARRAYGIQERLKRMPGHGNTFLDAWVDLREWEASDPSPAQAFLEGLDEGEIARFQVNPATRSIVRDLGLSYLTPEEMPTHSQLCELLSYAPVCNPVEAETLGERLSAWRSNGPYGCIFDGVTTHRLDGAVTHFELGLIKDAQEELRAAAHFLVMNTTRQQVVKRPRAERKFVLFEEGSRLLAVPGGARVLTEFYTQMAKYNCVAGTVFQQYTALRAADDSTRAAVFDNTKLFLVSAQPSPRAAEEIAEALELSEAAATAVKRYSMPEHQVGQKFASFLVVAPHPTRKLVGTFRNFASPAVVYCGRSDSDVWDERQKALSQYEDVVEGILTEAEKGNE
jgi:type IV secretion system protein TrbE